MPIDRVALAPDEAALLVVFDPSTHPTLENLSRAPARQDLSPEIPPMFAAVISTATKQPWTVPPLFGGGMLVLRLRKHPHGNAAPDVREAAANERLAVFDCATKKVFASADLQAVFEKKEWSGAATGTDDGQLYPGSFVRHEAFGNGRVLDVGNYKGMLVYVIRFDDRARLISVQHGGRYLTPLRAE